MVLKFIPSNEVEAIENVVPMDNETNAKPVSILVHICSTYVQLNSVL